jgi:hypothetical protein
MPLVRYFLYVGGALLALLLIADSYLPRLPAPETEPGQQQQQQQLVIRIRSERKWPERIVYDTSHFVPATYATPQAGNPAPAPVLASEASARAAFASLQPSDSAKQPSADQKKADSKQQRQRRARRRGPPPVLMVARQPQFGWFGPRFW